MKWWLAQAESADCNFTVNNLVSNYVTSITQLELGRGKANVIENGHPPGATVKENTDVLVTKIAL